MDLKQDNSVWKVLNSSYVSQRPWFTARVDHVQLPNGNEIEEYYILEYPEWVNVIAITKEKEFVMVKQYRHGIAKTAYELCAGVVDATDTTFLAAAQRELLEETGYGNGRWTPYMQISANPGTHTNFTHCFLAEDVELVAPPTLEATEDLSVHLLQPADVVSILQANEMPQALHAAPLWRYIAEHRLL
ncbi:8-oxo-dGTP pyrophosphatase MutT (NUDIX family) [Chitinophaga skermanii]|uniref:GDP-mannose pyrophosphatase n=1 Tax=Chitinophaga skermanii TaxID=331697 RepID=A0A327QXZ0_9BACT|nr:NUDIX hydrolase [Chitinophaga skermanii]RAJ08835.1 8-oxo-dGTP pyrophosphatase MutT (NUDIX family) [Chitinophaga skermanii]